MSELRASDAADAPVEAMADGGVARVSGAIWDASTDVLGDLQREAHTYRNLHPGGEEDL